MNFYRKRPLAAAVTLSLIIYAASAFMGASARLILSIAIALVAAVAIVLSHRYKTLRICGIPMGLFAVVTAVSLLLAILSTHAYYDNYENRYREIGETGETKLLSAEVISVESQTMYNAVYKIKLHSPEGGATGLVYTEEALFLWPGCLIEFEGEFCPLEDFYEYGASTRLTLLADGCVFACKIKGSADMVGERTSLSVAFTKIRQAIGAKISVYLDRDGGALSEALLLGERDGLGRIYRDFYYSGVLHILALSGMHIAIISSFFERILLRLKVPALARCLGISLLMLLYMALTGFSPSVVRAVLMLLFTYISGFLRKDADRVTSLFVVLSLMLFLNPPSVYDVGFQLSFTATLGVLLMTDDFFEVMNIPSPQDKLSVKLKYRLRPFLNSLYASLGASVFIIPLQWLYFGETSLLSIPATLILTPILNLLLTLLLPYLLFALLGIREICQMFAIVLTLLCRLTGAIAKFLGEIPSLISLRYPFSAPVILIFAATIVLMVILNVKSWRTAVIPYILTLAILVGGTNYYEAKRATTPTLEYVASGTNDIFVTLSRGDSMIVDFTNGSGYAVYHALDALTKLYATDIDVLLITNLTSRHVSAFQIIASKRVVHKILVPAPEDELESRNLEALYGITEEYGGKLILYSRGDESDIRFGDLQITLPRKTVISRSTQILSAAKFTAGSATLSYVGSSSWENQYVRDFVSGGKYVIFGTNGPIFKGFDLDPISEGALFVHTADESLARELTPYLEKHSIPLSLGGGFRVVFG